MIFPEFCPEFVYQATFFFIWKRWLLPFLPTCLIFSQCIFSKFSGLSFVFYSPVNWFYWSLFITFQIPLMSKDILRYSALPCERRRKTSLVSYYSKLFCAQELLGKELHVYFYQDINQDRRTCAKSVVLVVFTILIFNYLYQ